MNPPTRTGAGSHLAAWTSAFITMMAVSLLTHLTHAQAPSPDFFPILPWDRMQALDGDADRRSGLASAAECGFTIAGFVRASDVPACERLGLRAIVYPEPDSGLANPKRRLTDEQIDQQVRRLAELTRDSPAVLGYYIRDEPGARSFPYLGRIVAAVKAHAPGKLAYINLFPGYATLGATDTSQLQTATFAEYLERYVREVKPQFLSYDNYMVQYSQDLRDPAKAAAYFRDLLEVRRVALEHDLPFWNIVSSNQIRPFATVPSPANLLLQAWTTLAAGGRGVSWYRYTQGGYQYAPIDKEGRRTVTWSYLRMVNEQLRVIGPIMNRLRSTGVGFSGLTLLPGAPALPGRLVQAVECAEPLMIGEFAGADEPDHAILVNLSLERSARVQIRLAADRPMEVYSPVDGRRAAIGAELWLTAGQGMLVCVRRAE